MGDIVSGSVITSNGQLTPNFEYIAKLREAQSKVAISGDFSSEKKVRIVISNLKEMTSEKHFSGVHSFHG